MTRNARRVHRAYQQGYTAGWWRGWALALALSLGGFVWGVVGGHVAAQWRGAHQALSRTPSATITITPGLEERWLAPVFIQPTCPDCLEL